MASPAKKPLLQPKIKNEKLSKYLLALKIKTRFRLCSVEREEERFLNIWKKEILFKSLVTISASFLPPEPEGTNSIGKMLLEEIWSPFPWKYHACFGHCYSSSLKLWDLGWGGRQVILHGISPGSAGPALSQEPICLTIPKCHLRKSGFKANLWKLFVHVQSAFTRHFNTYKTLLPVCIAFF